MFLFALLGAAIIGAVTGYGAHWFGLVRKDAITSILVGLAGALCLYMLTKLFGFSVGGQLTTSIFGAAIALFLAGGRS